MARFPIEMATLHNPLFVNANLGTSLIPRNRTGLKLTFDTELDALIVEYQHKVTLVFSSNIASATLVNWQDIGIEQPDPTTILNNAIPSRAIIQPTAPAQTPPMARPMGPPVHIPQRTAQVSHPVHDQVQGPSKPTHPPKYMPHSPLEIQRAQNLALSGEIRPGAPAPTKADLVAAGKLEGDPVSVLPAKRGRPRKSPSPEAV